MGGHDRPRLRHRDRPRARLRHGNLHRLGPAGGTHDRHRAGPHHRRTGQPPLPAGDHPCRGIRSHPLPRRHLRRRHRERAVRQLPAARPLAQRRTPLHPQPLHHQVPGPRATRRNRSLHHQRLHHGWAEPGSPCRDVRAGRPDRRGTAAQQRAHAGRGNRSPHRRAAIPQAPRRRGTTQRRMAPLRTPRGTRAPGSR